VGKKEPSYTAGMNVSQHNCYRKPYRRSSKKLYIELPYDSAVLLLGISPTECKSGYNKGTYTPRFIAALFIIAKLWKQLRRPTTDECIKKMWYLYTM
jgi:hypothetical protein